VELLKIKKGLRSISSSEHFPKVLEIVLAVGNFLNHGGRAGNTVGFDISILVKLAETRANDPVAGTLLDFVISTMESSYPDAMNFTKELAELKYAKEASWEKIDTLIKDLRAQITVIKGLITSIPLLSPPTVDLFPKIKDAVAKAEDEFDETRILFDAVVDDWAALAKLYAKDHTKLKPEQFFESIHEFMAKFEGSIRDREKRLEEARKWELKLKNQADMDRRKREVQDKKKAKMQPTKEDEAEIEGILNQLVSSKKPSRPAAPSNATPVAAPPEPEEPALPPPTSITPEPTTVAPQPEPSASDREARRAAIQAKQRARRAALETNAPSETPEPAPQAREQPPQTREQPPQTREQPPQTREQPPQTREQPPQTAAREEPPSPAETPAPEVDREADRAARRAAIQAKHRARLAALGKTNE